jgi:hypothetical protein
MSWRFLQTVYGDACFWGNFAHWWSAKRRQPLGNRHIAGFTPNSAAALCVENTYTCFPQAKAKRGR